MCALGLALTGVLAITAPMAAHANGPGSNMRPGNAGAFANIVLVGDGGGSGGHSGAIGGRPTAGRAPQQWNRGPGFAHWGPNHQYGGWGFWRAVGADLLGVGPWECNLRLSLRGLARSARRLGQSVAGGVRNGAVD